MTITSALPISFGRKILMIIGLLTLGDAAPLFAAQESPAMRVSGEAVPLPTFIRDSDGGITIRATRLTEGLRIDGRIEETVYQRVPAITEFVQQEPANGAPITENTEVWVFFDDENLYLACRCRDEHPERIVANDMRRDGSNQTQHDQFSMTIDTFLDRRNGFLFGVTAAGGLRDGEIADERPFPNWNGVFEARATRSSEGWAFEMAVPFKSLRYAAGDNQIWGIQLRRFISSKNERAHITRMSPAGGTQAINYMSQAARLIGLEVPPPGLNLEVKPYAVGRMTTDRLANPPSRNDPDGDLGADLRLAVTKSLTLAATYNTDFAQVEADEAQVNLTRFSLSLPEKRDFFLESAGVFAFGSPAGGGGGDAGGGGDQPTVFYSRRIGLDGSRSVPVLGGARFTGTAGGWNIGAFNMQTDDDVRAVQTNFTVVRLRRNILRRSTMGGIYTRRSISTVAPGGNDVWGLDANFGFYQNVYFAASLAQSRTDGRAGDDLNYRTQFNYTSDRYGLMVDRLVVERNFNPEVGFLRRRDFRRHFAQGRFSPRTTNNPVIRRWTYQTNFEYTTDNKNRLETREAVGSVQMELHNGDSVSAQYTRAFEFLPAAFDITSGIRIPVGEYRFSTTRLSVNLGQQHKVSGNTTFERGGFYGGEKTTASFSGRVEITPQFGIEPNVSLNWIDLPQGSFAETVVGSRATYTMSPKMFVALLTQYGSKNKSVLSNFRFRWEYQPGSEIFVVYTEGRSTAPPRGTDLQNRGLTIKINRLFRF